jgi:hypothetical protein
VLVPVTGRLQGCMPDTDLGRRAGRPLSRKVKGLARENEEHKLRLGLTCPPTWWDDAHWCASLACVSQCCKARFRPAQTNESTTVRLSVVRRRVRVRASAACIGSASATERYCVSGAGRAGPRGGMNPIARESAMISLHRSTHSVHIATPPGPATSCSTWCCPLLQKLHLRLSPFIGDSRSSLSDTYYQPMPENEPPYAT